MWCARCRLQVERKGVGRARVSAGQQAIGAEEPTWEHQSPARELLQADAGRRADNVLWRKVVKCRW